MPIKWDSKEKLYDSGAQTTSASAGEKYLDVNIPADEIWDIRQIIIATASINPFGYCWIENRDYAAIPVIEDKGHLLPHPKSGYEDAFISSKQFKVRTKLTIYHMDQAGSHIWRIWVIYRRGVVH